MIFGLATIALGYALFYWGLHHFPGQQRYSLWDLLGFGTLFKNVSMPSGQPVQFKA